MPHEATVDHSSLIDMSNVYTKVPIVRLCGENDAPTDLPSPKRRKQNDGYDHVPHLRANKPRRSIHQHDEDLDSDESECSTNNSESN